MSDLIDRQAAIDALADYIHNVDKVMGTGHLTADDCKDAAASVFEELPSAQPKVEKDTNIPINDCISRKAAIDAMEQAKEQYFDRRVIIGKMQDIVNNLPSAQTERKKGKWDERKVFDTEDSDIAEMQSAKCSACGKYHTTPYLYFFDNFNFCPNCGARMVDDDIS